MFTKVEKEGGSIKVTYFKVGEKILLFCCFGNSTLHEQKGEFKPEKQIF